MYAQTKKQGARASGSLSLSVLSCLSVELLSVLSVLSCLLPAETMHSAMRDIERASRARFGLSPVCLSLSVSAEDGCERAIGGVVRASLRLSLSPHGVRHCLWIERSAARLCRSTDHPTARWMHHDAVKTARFVRDGDGFQARRRRPLKRAGQDEREP